MACWIITITDRQVPALVGNAGAHYCSPPHTDEQAKALLRILLDGAREPGTPARGAARFLEANASSPCGAAPDHNEKGRSIMQAPTHTHDVDPAARAAIEAAVLAFPARNSRVLWRDAELIAREDGADEVGACHLRQALRLQYAIAAAIHQDPAWSRARSVLRQRRRAPHCAERAGS